MSAAEWPRPSGPALESPESSNHPRVRGSGGKRRAQRSQEAPAELRAPAPLAGFVGVEARPMDADTWPVAPVIWWEPELPLQLPESGLRNERLHKVRLGGFLNVELTPCVRLEGLMKLAGGVSPELPATQPSSDLTPHGWDPRSASPASARLQAAPLGEKE